MLVLLGLTILGCSMYNPKPENPENVKMEMERGAQVFAENCQRCHGAGGIGPNLFAEKHSAFMIKAKVRTGPGQMPAFGLDRISENELNDVIIYIQHNVNDAS
jgi:ubiquinol-cytochrome c reductase cytochrome c subunit